MCHLKKNNEYGIIYTLNNRLKLKSFHNLFVTFSCYKNVI